MVSKRSLKACIKKFCIKLCLIVVLFTTISVFVFNAVFASSPRVSYPVEIIWENDDPASRPAQVSLQLESTTGTNYGSPTIFTSANQDPENPNRWFGFVSYYNAGSTNLIVTENSIGGDYTITQSAKPTCQANQAITIVDIHQADNSLKTTGSHTVTNADFILTKQGNTYYGWSAHNAYNGEKLSDINNAIHDAISSDITIPNNNWKQGATGNMTIGALKKDSYTSNSAGTSFSYTLSSDIDELYYGILTDTICSMSTVINTGTVVRHTLTVHHLNEDGTAFAPDTVTSYVNGATYTAEPIADDDYVAELQNGTATGVITEDIEVTYVYHPKYHNVTYSFSGSTLPPNASTLLPAATQYEQGDTVTVAAEPTAAGYRFLGWQKDGEPISGSFEMPDEDVLITGSWEQFNGYFTPSISMNIENESDYYRVLDTVTFAINVTNSESYPIHDVVVDELLDGATFIAGSDYTVVSDQQASIPTIAAGETVTLYATYQVARDVTETITNTAEITSATADNYYFFSTTQDCIDSTDFEVRSWQDDPVVTGINSNSTTLYYVLMLAGAIGAGIGVVNINNKKKITKGRK